MQLSVGPVIRVCVCVCDRGRGSRASLLHGERLASVVNGFTIVMSVVLARRRAGPPFRLRGCPSMCPAGIKQHTRPPPALIHLRDSLYSDATKNSARKLLLKTCNVCLIKIFDCGSIHFTISSGIGNWRKGAIGILGPMFHFLSSFLYAAKTSGPSHRDILSQRSGLKFGPRTCTARLVASHN